MKLIKPVAIGADQLISSSVPETAPAAWDGGTTYAAGTEAAVVDGGVTTVYEAKVPRNLLPYSQDFTAANWLVGGGLTVTANNAQAPDATMTATTIAETSNVSQGQMLKGMVIPNDASAYTISLYVKKSGSSATTAMMQISFYGGGADSGNLLFFNPGTGAFSTAAPTSSCGVEDLGAYWRFWLSAQNNASGHTTLYHILCPVYGGATPGDYDPSKTGSIVVWGAQAEIGPTLTAYVATQSRANVGYAPAASPNWWRRLANVLPTYAAGTTYDLADQVLNPSRTRIVESVQAANTGHSVTDAAWWLDIGPANRWAMFDQSVGTLTSEGGAIEVTLAPGAVSALAVLDTNAELVRVVMTAGGVPIYDTTRSTNAGGGMIGDWYAYFTAELGKVTTLTFLDLPLYPTAEIAVTITGPDPDAPVTIGTLLVGTIVDLGLTETGPSIGIADFSRKATNDYGVTDIVERPWSKRMTIRSLVSTPAVDNVQRRLAEVRARPALWLGEDGYDSLAIYGFYKDFSIDLALETESYVSLTIEGLI